MKIPDEVPLFLLSNQVLLPGGIIRIPFTTNKSVQIVINSGENPIVGVLPCKNKSDVCEGAICTAAAVVDMATVTGVKKTLVLSLIGLSRLRIQSVNSDQLFPVAKVTPIDENVKDSYSEEDLNKLVEEFKTNIAQLFSGFEVLQYRSLLNKFQATVDSLPKFLLLDFCASLLSLNYDEKLDLLNTPCPMERLKKLIPLIQLHSKSNNFWKVLQPNGLKDKAIVKVGSFGGSPIPFGGRQSKFPSHSSANDEEDNELEEKLKSLNLPEVVSKVVNRELKQMKRLSPIHMDYGIHRNYLELISELPWDTRTSDTNDIAKSKQELERDHYGMEKVKKRVLELLAVRQLKPDIKGPILCFVGSPGVGKTSIGRSIAACLGRKFHRISLGGVSLHSEIRGHRKTYVGAMAGRIIQALRTVQVKNPVILLDEIDKLSKSYNGDPASALLEVLDAEQNNSFVDHYLSIPFDLSEILFIATANTVKTIPPALKDRLEIINMSPYTLEEKKKIVERHLLPKQLREHGLGPVGVCLPDDMLTLLITGYTKEAGVRSLERHLAALCRRAAIDLAFAKSDQMLTNDDAHSLLITKDVLEDTLGVALFESGGLGSWGGEVPGVVVGLSWTPVGGEIMMVEATRVAGSSNNGLTLTGHLGTVIQESAKIAFSWLRSVSYKYGLNDPMEGENEVHIHFPAGSVSKEGPSAGVTVAVALLSLFSGIPVPSSIALTGELTLRGAVLPVGGIKEKLMAAHSAGVKTVIIPEKCKRNLLDIPKTILDDLEVVLVNNMEDVVKVAFNGQVVCQKGSNLLTSKI